MRKTALRTEEMHEWYENAEKDPHFMDTAPSVNDYHQWRVIKNQFPYDVIAEKHHMLVLRRDASTIYDLTPTEQHELTWIIHTLGKSDEYDQITLNTQPNQSHPQRIHFHLIKLKEL